MLGNVFLMRLDGKVAAAGVCGMIGPVATLALISLAISYSPWFSWKENALSDLGVSSAAVLFNSSLILSGLFSIVFAVGLRKILKDRRLGNAGTLLLILASADLSAIGVFPETAGVIHFYVSVVFFTLLPLSLLAIGAAMMQRSSERNWGLFTFIVGLVAGGIWIVPWGGGVAIPETLSVLPVAAWSIVLGVKMVRQASH